ncbi:glutaredoxin family protein [Calidithermus chliarophilus]|uniref:glutaredoxin family protein n=1 Tax=Calidithermus chliarophilus TaxID=52023 RepID=UPI0004211F51|nr:glutaredoxin family protein [Calidithermus chliarophilus]
MSYVLVSRKGCHLCEEAEQMLGALRLPFELRDVDQDPELRLEYSFRVPVLLRGSEVLMEGRFDAPRLVRLLEQSGDGAQPVAD